jgi:hypothetical protein
VTAWGIRMNDLMLEDPPVVMRDYSERGESTDNSKWVEHSPTVSQFALHMFAYATQFGAPAVVSGFARPWVPWVSLAPRPVSFARISWFDLIVTVHSRRGKMRRLEAFSGVGGGWRFWGVLKCDEDEKRKCFCGCGFDVGGCQWSNFGGGGGGFESVEAGGVSFVFMVELRGGVLPEGGGGKWDRAIVWGFSAKPDIVIDDMPGTCVAPFVFDVAKEGGWEVLAGRILERHVDWFEMNEIPKQTEIFWTEGKRS